MKSEKTSLIELAAETANSLFLANKAELSKSAKTLMEISRKFGFDEAKKLDLNQYRKMRTDSTGDNIGTIINKVKELCGMSKLIDDDIPCFLGYLSRELKYLESAKAFTHSDVSKDGKATRQGGNRRGDAPYRPVSGPATYNPFENLRKKLDN